MKSNGLLKWLLLPVLGLAVYVGIQMLSTSDVKSGNGSRGSKTGSVLTDQEAKSLGVEGDTAHDTVATLVAQVKQLRHELNAATESNKAQKSQNDRVQVRDDLIDQRVQTALKAERERWQQEQDNRKDDSEERHSRGVIQELQQRLDEVSKKSGHADLPVGFGLQDRGLVEGEDAVRWHEPLDARPSEDKKPRRRPASNSTPASSAAETPYATSFGLAIDSASDSHEIESSLSPSALAAKVSLVDRVYTVPANSTLIGSTAMTALIGRVPIDGTVNDPYPFKVVVGPDNLAANGIDLPNVAGAVVSGTASGDWTLSCVRGEIRSVTFVFADGTIRTVSSSAKGGTGNSFDQGLGWISDPYGVPCVSGERRSNAQQYLGSQMLITAAGAGAASLIDAGGSNFSYANSSNGSLGTVGISSNEAMGRILGSGVAEMSQWVNKLYGQAFAAVYVRPGAKVAVHIEQSLEIDYDKAGRKVAYRLGEVHAPDLD